MNWVGSKKFGPENPMIYIVTDSQNSIDCFTKWVHGWKKNGWKTKTRKNVKHSEDEREERILTWIVL